MRRMGKTPIFGKIFSMIRHVIFFLFVIVNFSSALGQTCSQLKNGRYRIKYDKPFKRYPKRIIKIFNDSCYISGNGEKRKYSIVKMGECRFRLKDNVAIDTNNLTPFEKVMDTQQLYYDIYKVKGNNYFFCLQG